ncbi:hypothetical protein STRDD11_01736 [Streptococcus sp. DD11]|nr:hypothetical protein STRDD11_01736 [Streptococcus sp. DD11]
MSLQNKRQIQSLGMEFPRHLLPSLLKERLKENLLQYNKNSLQRLRNIL